MEFDNKAISKKNVINITANLTGAQLERVKGIVDFVVKTVSKRNHEIIGPLSSVFNEEGTHDINYFIKYGGEIDPTGIIRLSYGVPLPRDNETTNFSLDAIVCDRVGDKIYRLANFLAKKGAEVRWYRIRGEKE